MTETTRTMLQKKPATTIAAPAPKITPLASSNVPRTADNSPPGHNFADVPVFPEGSGETMQRQEGEEEEEEGG